MMHNVKTVFLDIDDTLWWFTENSKEAFAHVYNQHGLDRLCSYERFHEVYIEKNRELWEAYHHGKIGKAYLNSERFRYTLEHCGYQGDALELGNKLNAHYLNYLVTLPRVLPGAKELLEYLKAKGYDVNTLSNGFAHFQPRKLVSGGLDGYIHRNILSDDCGITKPLPGIFDYALATCGASRETTVMIGDDPDADIAGAHNAGWRTIYFNWKQQPVAPGAADATVTHLLEVERLL